MKSNYYGFVECKLSELLDIKYGKDHKHLAEGTIPVYGSGGLMRYAEKALYEKESILIPRKGSLNNIYYTDKPFWTVDTMFYSKIQSNVVGKFLYFYLKTIDFASMNVGSAVPSMTIEILRNLEIPLPDIETQTRIAAILSSLDDKIELNRQMNATLEGIAQTLFQEMCLPKAGERMEGWREGKIGDICRNIRNTAHPKDLDFNTVYVGLEHIPRKSLCLNEYGISSEVSSQKSRFKAFDILFGRLRPYFHKVCIAPTNGICSTDILVIEPIHRDYFTFCLNHLFSDELIKYVSLIADGTRMPRVDWKSISDCEIMIPPVNIIQKLNTICLPFYEQMLANSQETQTLTTLRDSLLPKLMRGELLIGKECIEPETIREIEST